MADCARRRAGRSRFCWEIKGNAAGWGISGARNLW